MFEIDRMKTTLCITHHLEKLKDTLLTLQYFNSMEKQHNMCKQILINKKILRNFSLSMSNVLQSI